MVGMYIPIEHSCDGKYLSIQTTIVSQCIKMGTVHSNNRDILASPPVHGIFVEQTTIGVVTDERQWAMHNRR